MFTRSHMLQQALAMTNIAFFDQVFYDPRVGANDRNAFIGMRVWAKTGAQSVQMPETFAAALMASSAREAIELDDQLPWPAFEIIPPQNLLRTTTGAIFSILVVRIPPEYVAPTARYANPLQVMWFDEQGATTVRLFDTLRGLTDDEAIGGEATETMHISSDFDRDEEDRVALMIGRLVQGVVLLIHQARTERKGAFAPKPMQQKRGALKPNAFQLGKPLTLDCRGLVREYVAGSAGSASSAPSVTTVVRGHFKNQAHGQGRALRRLQWVMPYQRGQGPQLVRVVKLKPDGLEGLGELGGFEMASDNDQFAQTDALADNMLRLFRGR